MKGRTVGLDRIGGVAALMLASALTSVIGVQAAEPLTLTAVKELPGIGGERMLVRGERLFVQGDASLAIYDAADAANPQLLGTLSLPTQAVGMVAGMTASDTLLALVAYPAAENKQRIYLVDITAPATPSLVTSWQVNATAMLLHGGHLYVTSSTANTFQIHDVSNPASPQAVFNAPPRVLPLEGGGTTTDMWFAEGVGISGHHAFTRFGDGRREGPDNTRLPLLVSWDISNPVAPAETAAVPLPTAIDYLHPSCAIGNTTLFMGRFFFGNETEPKGGLAVDIGNPAAPAFLADMAWNTAAVGANGTSLFAAPTAAGNCALMPMEDGVACLDLSTPAAPSVKGTRTITLNDAGFLGEHIAALLPDKLVLFRKPGVGDVFDAYSVIPAEIGMSAAATLVVNGNGFVPGTTAVLTNGADTINPASLDISAGGDAITAVFDLSAAAPGVWQLRVTAPGQTPQQLPLTVAAGPAITVATTSPDAAQAWGKATLTVGGDGFGPDMTAQLKGGRAAMLTAESATAAPDGRSATLVFDVTGAYPGPRTLVVSRPGMTRGELPNATRLDSALRIDGAAPASVFTGYDFAVTVTGAGFLDGDTVQFARAGNETLAAANKTVSAEGTSMTVTVHAGSADVGAWGLDIMRGTGEHIRKQNVLTVLAAPSAVLAVTPPIISGLAQQITLRITHTALPDAQLRLRTDSAVIPAAQLLPAGSGVADAVFNADSALPLGWVTVELIQNNVTLSSQLLRVVAAVHGASLSETDSLLVSGEGFTPGCSAWIEEVNTGQKINASNVTDARDTSLVAGFAGALPNGTWRVGVRGPNGREIMQNSSPDAAQTEARSNLVVGSGLSHLSAGEGGQANNVTLTVYGAGFCPAQSIRLTRGDNVIEGTNITCATDTGTGQAASVTFDLSDAEKGAYDITVTTEGGAACQLKNAFTVADAKPKIAIRLNMPDKTRVGRTISCEICIVNGGNVDAYGAVTLDGIPSNATYSFPKLPAGVEDAMTTQEKIPGGLGTVQLNEIKVAAGQTLLIPVNFSMNREGSIAVTPHWVGVHQK